MTNKHGGSSIPLLLKTLKSLFKVRGITYAHISAALGVSEMTVKRHFSGCGLKLEVLEKLSQLAGMSLFELSELAAQEFETKETQLTVEQERALAEHDLLAITLHLLMLGWPPRRIQIEFDLSDADFVTTLAYLDRLGFIDLLPGNKVRLRTSRELKWSQNERLKQRFASHLKKYFNKDFDSPDVNWRYAFVKLSDASICRLESLFETWIQAVKEMAHEDFDLPAAQGSWRGVLLASQPLDMKSIGKPTFLVKRNTAAKASGNR